MDMHLRKDKTMSDQLVAHDGQAEAWRTGPSLHEAESATTILKPQSRGRQTLRFLRHFGEMVLAMLLGMSVFDVVTGVLLIPMGLEVSALAMAVAMTVPMVAWMRIRKHAWRPSVE